MTIAVNFQLKQLERSLKKNQGFNGIRTRDLRDTIEPLNHLLLLFEFYIFKSYKPTYSKANVGGLYYYFLIYRAKVVHTYNNS